MGIFWLAAYTNVFPAVPCVPEMAHLQSLRLNSFRRGWSRVPSPEPQYRNSLSNTRAGVGSKSSPSGCPFCVVMLWMQRNTGISAVSMTTCSDVQIIKSSYVEATPFLTQSHHQIDLLLRKKWRFSQLLSVPHWLICQATIYRNAVSGVKSHQVSIFCTNDIQYSKFYVYIAT